jgi:hypothetical protein
MYSQPNPQYLPWVLLNDSCRKMTFGEAFFFL